MINIGQTSITRAKRGVIMKKTSWIALTLILSIYLASANIRLGKMQYLPEPQISVVPRLNSAPTTEHFTILLNITDATLDNSLNGVYGWEVDMSFNASVIQAASITEGTFLSGFWPPEITNTTFTTEIDNVTGVIVATCYYFPYPDFGAFVYGDETLASVEFEVIAPGKCDLDIYKTILNTYIPPPPSPGQILPISHTSKDGFFQYPVGDADGDGKVDVFDLYELGIAFDSVSGGPGWNPDCDFDKDDDVDSSDLSEQSANYGTVG